MIAPTSVLLDLDTVRIDPELARRVPESLALRRGVLLVGRSGDDLLAACIDPKDLAAIEALERVVGGRVIALAAEPESLRRALRRVFTPRLRPVEVGVEDDAAQVLDDLLRSAIIQQASDIHVEPSRTSVAIRFRVDGTLELHRELPQAQVAGLMNRIKVLSDLDIAERRAPQDGRFTATYGPAGDTRTVDIRVAVMPVKHGERATLRLLALRTEALGLAQLGFPERDLGLIRRAIAQPHGLVLLTGPTGSGKTTTLYAAMREVDVASRNVLTLEDPVEYDIAGVSQSEIDPSRDLTFASGLRALLRHDPDVLLVGEIRDHETADVSVKASLTGHLVLSTLHTNSAVSAVTRLLDMGVEPYLLAATLKLAVAQRLVRRLCIHCRVEARVTAPESALFSGTLVPEERVYRAAGCGLCRGTGYAGRFGVFETFAPDADCVQAIAAGCPESELLAIARAGGLRLLREDAALRIRAGLTSIDETVRSLEGI